MRQPGTNKHIKDRNGDLWHSWTDNLGDRWWGMVDNEDADPLTWRQLEHTLGPLKLV